MLTINNYLLTWFAITAICTSCSKNAQHLEPHSKLSANENSQLNSEASLTPRSNYFAENLKVKKRTIRVSPLGIYRMVQPKPIGKTNDAIVSFSYTTNPDLMEVGIYSFDSGNLQCLTCNLKIGREPHGSFARPIPISEERIVVQAKVGSRSIGNEALFSFYVLECSPSILNCQKIVAKEISNVKQKGDLTVRFHLPSPDGKKLVWQSIRPVGGVTKAGSIVLMLGDLSKDSIGRYKILNPVVINPNARISDIGSPEELAVRSTFFEPKEFCNGGNELFLTSTLYRSTDIDNFMLNLNSGSITRLTTSAGWDEGGSCSPNHKLLVQAVQRIDRTASAFSALSRPPFLDGVQALGNLKNYYVVGKDGKDWPRRGGRRSVVIHPIEGESSGDEFILSDGEKDGWFVGPGEPVFFHDNRRLVWSETKEMTTETRLVLAEIDTDLANAPNPIYNSLPNPTWAFTVDSYPNFLTNPPGLIHDGQGGTAVISEQKNMKEGKIITTIVYNNFIWKDARLNGQEKATLIFWEEGEAPGHLPYFVNIQTNLKSEGDLTGTMTMNANIFEGCGENLTEFKANVNGTELETPWPAVGGDCDDIF